MAEYTNVGMFTVRLTRKSNKSVNCIGVCVGQASEESTHSQFAIESLHVGRTLHRTNLGDVAGKIAAAHQKLQKERNELNEEAR